MSEFRKAYGYVRCSNAESSEIGLSPETQKAAIASFIAYLQKQDPELTWGGWVEDEGVSAWKTPFFGRPSVKKLRPLLKPGDVIVAYKLTRAFRNTQDCLSTVQTLQKMGVKLHMLDLQIDYDTPHGELMLTLLGAIAQFESGLKSEWGRGVHAARRERGATHRAGYGFTLEGPPGGKVLRPNPDEWWAIELVLQLRAEGYSKDAANKILQEEAARRGTKCSTAKRLLIVYKHYQEQEKKLADLYQKRQQEQ